MPEKKDNPLKERRFPCLPPLPKDVSSTIVNARRMAKIMEE